MPSFFVPARSSRHRAACFALYRALLRQAPRIPLPDDLSSRPGWTNPIRFLIRTGFRRNKDDTSPRLVTSALKSGYRFLNLLARAHDATSPTHPEVVGFLRDRQDGFPPPRPPPPPKAPRERPPPLLTKVSEPGSEPVYRSTVRPRPLAELSGGVRKVPVLDETNSIAFLRIGKPQSHSLAMFLRRKTTRRHTRITAMQQLWDDAAPAAAEEDMWEETIEMLALEEGVDVRDAGDEGGSVEVADQRTREPQELGTYQHTVREHGIKYLTMKLDEEAADSLARATAMLDIVDQEKKLAEQEKEAKRQRRRRAWEEKRAAQEQEQG